MNPTNVSKNQQGEQWNQFLIGGSNQIDCNFIVDHANGNGLGQRSLKGSPLISQVYLYTSATPAAGNPLGHATSEGYAVVELSEAFQGYIAGFSGFGSPTSGTPINVTAGLTVGKAYIIVSVGTTTPAQWQALGLPANQTPNVGTAFICTSATAGVGTGVVEVDAASGVDHVELVGDPNQTVNPATGGGYFIVKFCFEGAAAQPNDGTVVGFRTSLNAPTNGPVI